MLTVYDISSPPTPATCQDVSYLDYAKTICPVLYTPRISLREYTRLSPVFAELLTRAPGLMCRSSLVLLYAQLLTGCRVGEVVRLRVHAKARYTEIFWATNKTQSERYVRLITSSPILRDWECVRQSYQGTLCYRTYYEELYHVLPSACRQIASGHLTGTHIIRHYYVQTLYYVCGLTAKEIQVIMGWYGDSTIASYIDRKLFTT